MRSQDVSHAVVVQQVARLPFQAEDGGSIPTPRLHFTRAAVAEVNPLLSTSHYLGAVKSARFCFAGWVDDVLVAAQVWRWPTARMLPSDGSWLELSRWCLTPQAGKNAGSRMMRWVRGEIRREAPAVRVLVSYSDPSAGHSGALYKASGWDESPTHHTERWKANGKGYPSGHGSWDGGLTKQHPKQRWTYTVALPGAVTS